MATRQRKRVWRDNGLEKTKRHLIHPFYSWMDEEIIGEASWTCPCGYMFNYEVMNIYDRPICPICKRGFKMIQQIFIEVSDSSDGTKMEDGV